MLTAPLPQDAQVDGPVRLCVQADLLPDGSFGKAWLAVTHERAWVFVAGEHGTETRYSIPLAEISAPKAVPLVGGGALEVTRDGASLELIRYGSGCLPFFSTAANLLGKWLKGEAAELPEVESLRCARCGLPLDAGTKVCPACLPKGRVIKRILLYLRPYLLQAVCLTLFAITLTIVGLVQPYLNKPLLDRVLMPGGHASPVAVRIDLLGWLVLLLIFSQVAKTVVGIVQGLLSSWLGNHIAHDVRSELFQQMQYLSLRFFDKRQMGSVISRVNQDTRELQGFLVWGAQDLTINLLLIVGIVTLLFVLDWRLALVVFAPAPLVAILTTMFWRGAHKYMHRFFRRWGRINAIITETLNGMRVVKAFAQEAREVGRFRGQSLALADAGFQAECIWSMTFALLTLLTAVGGTLVWYFGGREVLIGQRMTTGTLLAYLAYVSMFYGPIQAMSISLNWASRAMTAAERIFEVLDADPEVKESAQMVAMPYITGRVEFRDVSFGYDAHSPVLKHITFDVAPGEMIGLVGHSGAGKSTSINLLCRFYEATEGTILIDGVPINRIGIEDLRRQIGLVPQDTFLFSGTIADNIAYARPEAGRAEIIRAAKVANAHDFIRMKPDGYETQIGEGGKGLSGGEMQRLAIARAVLHNPRILILDEATSHVDVDTEKQVQEAIARLVKGRTTFAIAHRLSTLKNADRLLVLKAGEVAEIGSHAELLAKEDGEFYRLVKTYQEISNVQAVQK